MSVGEVSAVIETHREHRVPGVEDGKVGGLVRRASQVGLDIRMIHSEELLSPLDRDLVADRKSVV